MKSRRLLLKLSSYVLLMFSIFSFMGVVIIDNGFNYFFSYYFHDVPILIKIIPSITSFLYISDYIFFIDSFILIFVLGLLGLIYIYTNHLKKVLMYFSYVTVFLSIYCLISSIIAVSVKHLSLYYLITSMTTLILSGYFAFIITRICQDKTHIISDSKITNSNHKRKGSLLINVITVSIFTTFLFVLVTAGGLFFQNYTKAKNDRIKFAINNVDEAIAFIVAEDISNYINGTYVATDPEISRCQDYFASKMDGNGLLLKEYIIIPRENNFVYLLDDGRMRTTRSRSVEDIHLIFDYESYASGDYTSFKKAARNAYDKSMTFVAYNTYGSRYDKIIGTAFGPLVNRKGNVVAVCCVDFYEVSLREGFDADLVFVTGCVFNACLCVMLLLTHLVGSFIMKPIEEINRATKNVVASLKGEIILKPLNKPNNEIGELATSFDSVVQETKDYIKKTEILARENNHMLSQLEIAKEIQLSLLPKPPEYNPHFVLKAIMSPATIVGGDFYDHYYIDDNHFAITIGDISGKGISASVFMANAKAYLKATLKSVDDLAKAISIVNKGICETNSRGMFLTCFIGIIELSTGIMHYVNAGHVIPFIRKKDGLFEPLKLNINLLLGRFKNTVYEVGQIQLEEGDTIIQYSDGATDATNKNKKMLRFDGLIQLINKNAQLDVITLIPQILQDIETYEDGNARFDDITLFGFTYSNTSYHDFITVRSKLDNIDIINKYLNKRILKYNIDKKLERNCHTILDEIYRNIVSYAYKDENGIISFKIEEKDDDIVLVFIDEGIEFNMSTYASPNLIDSKRFKDGGLGIFIVKSLANKIQYERKDAKNILKIYLQKKRGSSYGI